VRQNPVSENQTDPATSSIRPERGNYLEFLIMPSKGGRFPKMPGKRPFFHFQLGIIRVSFSFNLNQRKGVTLCQARHNGNLAAKYDPNAANLQKTLRRQFGIFYDVK
jgi:hypothetical protein